MLVAVSVCAALYLWNHPAGLSLRFGTLMGLAFGLTLLVVRACTLELQYKVLST